VINLIRNYPFHKHESWAVTHTFKGDIIREDFATIELAAECLLKLNVKDDDIDNALIDMYMFNHIRAIFKDAKYSFSQDH